MSSISYKADDQNDTYISVAIFFRTIDNNDSGFKQRCSNIQCNRRRQERRKQKLKIKDEFGNTVEEKKIEEKEED